MIRHQPTAIVVIALLATAGALFGAVTLTQHHQAEAQSSDQGICNRTEAVRNAIVAAVPATESCSNVTGAQLTAITGTLDLSGLGITELQDSDLNGLTGLETLDLSDNELTGLYPDDFDEMDSLRTIDVSHNNVEYVGAPFSHNPDLESVNLSNNVIRHFAGDVFEFNAKLRSVNAAGNRITDQNLFPLDFTHAPDFAQLNLENNLLESVGVGLADDTGGLTSYRMAGNPGAPFTISVGVKQLGPDAIELQLGDGFFQATSDIVATLSATGAQLSASQATITAGEMNSEVIAVTPHDDTTPTVSVAGVSYDTSIYGGVSFVSGDPQPVDTSDSAEGICSRTKAVRETLLQMLHTHHQSCELVTDNDLSGLTEPFALVETDLASLRAGDLAGLTAVKDLYLYGNRLTELPAGLFKDAGNFERVLMQDNPGSDFMLEVNLVETETGATKAVIREGTPFWTIVELGAENGTVHPRIVNIYGGNTQSDESISVTPDTPGEEANITVERVSFQDTGLIKYHYHDGFHMVPGRDLRGQETVESTGDGGVYPSDPPVPEPTPAATATPTPTANPPAADSLTATLQNPHSFHDGESAFTFELRFSEEFGLSYKTLRDHAFTVSGGTVKNASRLVQGSNVGWRITVQPNGNGDVTVVLPETTYCDDQGAICTEDGRKLSHRLALTVNGPGQ